MTKPKTGIQKYITCLKEKKGLISNVRPVAAMYDHAVAHVHTHMTGKGAHPLPIRTCVVYHI